MSKKIQLNKKTSLFVLLIAIVVILIISFTFLGVFLSQRLNPITRFRKAEANWEKTTDKNAHDTINIWITLGYDENPLRINLVCDGKRYYSHQEQRFDYTISIKYDTIEILKISFLLNSDGQKITLSAKKITGLIDFNPIELDINNEFIADVELGDSAVSFYNTKNIIINKKAQFFIEEDATVRIMDIISLLINEIIDIDITDLLEEKTNISKVRGKCEYKSSFKLSSVTSTQNISFFMPWDEADEIVYSLEDIPEEILEIYRSRKITVISFTINLMDYLPKGILANIKVETTTKYSY